MGRARLGLTALAALALAATTCSHSSSTSAPSTDTTSSLPAAGGKGRTPTTTRHSVTTVRSGAQRPLTTSGSGAPSASPRATLSPTDPVVAAARRGPGAFAGVLLQPQPAPDVVYEILRQDGTSMSSQATNHVMSVLRAVTGKTVRMSGPAGLPSGNSSDNLNADDLTALADRYTNERQGGTQAVIHALFVHGSYQGNSSVLGVSVRGDVLAVFMDAIHANASPVASSSTLESAVTTHEVGHLLGLVDLYLHTGRQDPQHPGHSTDQHSVMYWAVDSDLVTQLLQGPPPVDFDDADNADLATIRQGG